jgi:hypothetical protein
MTDTVDFSDESRDRSILRTADYDDTDPADLVLTVPKREGGKISIPLLKHARSNIEREDYQDNTLVRIKPLAEIASNLPVRSGSNAPVYQGKGVALLRPGFLYIFREDKLWRELEISQNSQFSDIDLQAVRAEVGDPESDLRMIRPSAGQWLDDVLVPVFLQGQAVMHDFRMAYSEIQWDWAYIQRLEESAATRNARTTGVGHAWAVTSVDTLSFETGFPASRVEDAPELRHRDLGIELMIENPSDFVLSFERPGEDELCSKLAKLLESNEKQARESARRAASRSEVEDPIAYTEQLMKSPLELALEATAPEPEDDSEEGEVANILDLTCPPGADLLQHLRSQKGVVCVAIPDPLFKLRHSLAQLHLALHYLDAVDISIQTDPMAHSAMLIRQAVFDPLPNGSPSAMAKYAGAIDREKLNQVLRAAEKQHAIRIVEHHVGALLDLMNGRELDLVLDDYHGCQDIAVCEGYLLIADHLNILQQIPGVLKAQGVISRKQILAGVHQWVADEDFLARWAPGANVGEGKGLDNTDLPSVYERLKKLSENQDDIDEALLSRLNLQSLAFLEKQIDENNGDSSGHAQGIAAIGKVGGMISGALNEWSSSILTVCKRLIEEDVIQSIEIQRIMQGVGANLALAEPALRGIDVMGRNGIMEQRVIVGLYGNGLNRGLTDFDLTEGLLTRSRDYLYADLLDGTGNRIASTSPSRASEMLSEAIKKVSGSTFMFSAPADHPEVRKLSLLKVDYAKQIGKIVDGPEVSRGLVILAAFNVFLEANNVGKALHQQNGNNLLASSRLAGALTDLTAASFKLSEVLGRSGSGSATKMNRVATRPLFDMKNWVVIGDSLKAKGAPTLVRVVGLATFVAGSIGAGLSFWDMRISMSNKDFDVATGHAIAMTGSLVVLASPLMKGLLAIPGWGWAVFGLAMVVGGGLYASSATDDDFESLLKRGPWGTYPDADLPGQNERAYYSQLLALLSPIQVSAQRFAEVGPDPFLSHPDYVPKEDDYVVTLQCPLVSRLKLFQEECENLPERPFRLVVQEVAYQNSTNTAVDSGMSGAGQGTQMLATTPPIEVMARQSVPHQSAVRFLVRRQIQDSSYESLFYRESVTTQLRVGLQVTLDTELGPLVFPAPVLREYEPFDLARHSAPPPKTRSIRNPYSQPKSPYWYFTEVSV